MQQGAPMAWEGPTVSLRRRRTFEDDFVSEPTHLYVGLSSQRVLRPGRNLLANRVAVASVAFAAFVGLAATVGFVGDSGVRVAPPLPNTVARVTFTPIEPVVPIVTPIVERP
jgi:hypothetical protein